MVLLFMHSPPYLLRLHLFHAQHIFAQLYSIRFMGAVEPGHYFAAAQYNDIVTQLHYFREVCANKHHGGTCIAQFH